MLAAHLIARGEFSRVFRALHARIYNKAFELIFPLQRVSRRFPAAPPGRLSVITEHPVAFKSPDHLAPYGTKYNNSTNKKFVLLMDQHFRKHFGKEALGFMDLGCSGGQLVKDFLTVGWRTVGLEGSDYSLKHRRANWRELAGKNLFTCDITKPFTVTLEGSPLALHLITAWEVMEHIQPQDLPPLLDNIRKHLAAGGCFIASTCSGSSVVDGVELHQTRMSNQEWRAFIESRYPDLEPVDLGLRIYQYVRYDFGEPSFLVYRKRARQS